jgi:hypothetical protein
MLSLRELTGTGHSPAMREQVSLPHVAAAAELGSTHRELTAHWTHYWWPLGSRLWASLGILTRPRGFL